MGGFLKSQDLFPGEKDNSVEEQSHEIVLFVLVHKSRYCSVPQMQSKFTYREYKTLAREDMVLFSMTFQPYLHSRVEFA